MAPKNKFGAAFDAIREATDQETPAEAPQLAQEAATAAPARRSRAGRRARPAPPEQRGPGRPPGKRSDPDYRQVTGLIRRETHVAVLKQMLDEGRSRDMGELLEELFQRHYLKTKRRSDRTTS